MFTKDQFSGVADRLAIAVVTYLVAKGYVPQALSADLIQLLVIAAGLAWGWYVNRPQAILQSAAAIPNPAAADGKTQIVASPELAAATPEKNIQSSDANKVVHK